MRTIVLRKSELAQLKGLGKTTEEMAAKFGVTTKEMLNTLIGFNLSKAKPRVKEVAYVIQTVNDIDTVNDNDMPTAPVNEVSEGELMSA